MPSPTQSTQADSTMLTAIARRCFWLALLWWILTEAHSDVWALGLLAVAASAATSLRLLPLREGQRIGILALLNFLAYFLWNSVRGGIQVAALALRPRLDLAPTVLELTPALPPGVPRILMLNTLALMPGTVSLGLDNAQ